MASKQQANNYLELAFKKTNLLDCCTSSNSDEMIGKVVFDNASKASNFPNLISKYPVASYEEINNLLTKNFGKNSYFLGNGSEDLIVRINTVAKLLKMRIAVLKPIFYRIVENLDSYHEIGYKNIFESELNNVDICWIVNPNPINDIYLEKNKILNLIKKYPRVSFVVDETSIFFFNDWRKKTLFGEVKNYLNLTVISSLSKYFGVPGLRFGFGATNPGFLEEIKKTSPTFPINSIAAFYVITLLKNINTFDSYRKKIEINKKNIIKVIQQNSKIEVKSSNLNFVLCKSKVHNLYKGLLEKDLLSFDMNKTDNCNNGWVRLTVHSSDEINSQVVCKLLGYLKSIK